MKRFNALGRRAATAGLALGLGLAAAPAMATNGFIANGYGGGSKGMAGAGVAVPLGVLGLAQNPAMGTRVGNTAGFCLTTFAPDRSFTVSGTPAPPPNPSLTNGNYNSKNDVFFIPCGGVNFVLNERSSLGFFAFGNGGMNTEYGSNLFVPGFGPAGTSPLGVNLEQLFLTLNYSYDVTDQLTFGIAPVVAIQRFEATGLENFAPFSSAPGNLTNRGEDWSTGAGVNLGVVWEPNAQWRFGAAYRSKMYMEPFQKYSGLFAEEGDFDIPATATLGVAYTPPTRPDLTFTAEYQRHFYSEVKSLGNTHDMITTAFGADDGPGFGWKDMDVVRVGATWKANAKWTFRGGVSYATEFIDSDQTLFNVLAPATPQWHASLGASYRVNDNWGITAAYTHAFESSVTGANPSLAPGQPVKLRMNQHEFALGMTYRW